MRRRSFLTGSAAMTVVLVGMLASGSAHACRVTDPLELDHIKHADVVVIGRISNYRIGDAEFRRRILANPKLSPNLRKWYEGPNIGDGAHFDIQVDEVLAGTAPTNLSVIWTNGNFALPKTKAAGPYLIALRKWFPLRDPGTPTPPDPEEPISLIVVQGPCSPAFMLDASSELANKARLILMAGKL